MNDQINVLTDIYNTTFHSPINNKPRDIIFNTRNITNTEEKTEKFQNLQSAVKSELLKRKQNFEEKHSEKENPKQLDPDDYFGG